LPCSTILTQNGTLRSRFIHSIYAFDPNDIPIEFSAPVVGVDLKKHPKMKDSNPSSVALEGAEPQRGCWPEAKKTTPLEHRNLYPGEGVILAGEMV
jgi:hypothetical protein